MTSEGAGMMGGGAGTTGEGRADDGWAAREGRVRARERQNKACDNESVMTTQRTRLSVPLFDRLVPRYRHMKPYEPVAPPERLQAESGVGKEGIVRLNANENPYGPPPRVREVIASFDAAHIYPDPDHAALRAGLARYTGFDVERIVVGSGSDELIALLVRLFVGPGDTIAAATPTFGMYAFDADLAGARFVGVPRNAEDFSIDVTGLVEAARDASIVFFFDAQ